MKVLTFNRHFPKGHSREGQPTFFVEQILNSILPRPLSVGLQELPEAAKDYINDFMVIDGSKKKHHTIRAGARFKPGDWASLRIWSDKPYRSKQIEFAQVEIKRVWPFAVHVVGNELLWQIPGIGSSDNLSNNLKIIAGNDGLEVNDFVSWFACHPKKKEQRFEGQVISWSDKINYDTPPDAAASLGNLM